MSWYYLMPVIFVLGIIGIALEEQIKINKTATALLTSVVLWAILLMTRIRCSDCRLPSVRCLLASCSSRGLRRIGLPFL